MLLLRNYSLYILDFICRVKFTLDQAIVQPQFKDEWGRVGCQMPSYYNIIIGTYKTVKKLYLVSIYKYRVQWPRSAVSWFTA